MATETPVKASPAKEGAEVTSAKKRKADLEELEVDVDAPEPPSKRAKRALKKGKVLPPKPDSDDEKKSSSKKKKKAAAAENDDGTAGDDADDAKPASTRSEHAVWIGNLPFTVTINELRAWLIEKSGGAITEESMTRVNMPTQKLPGKTNKSNKGFAYVDFSDLGAKVAAVALSEEWLGIRKLLIKDSKSYEGRPKKEERAAAAAAAAETAAAEEPASRKIFVGNLGFQVTEDDVRANFDKCGEIDWVKLATFEDSGKCKGYGWVKFREAESAGMAVKGFVKIKEEIETEDDFVDGKKGEDGEDDDEKKDDAAAEKKFKTRKWWINRIAGRQLKIELAEDDQTRYKKRFKKGPQRKTADGQDQADGDAETQRPARKPAPQKELKAQDDLMVARLTGAAAKPTGTKITF